MIINGGKKMTKTGLVDFIVEKTDLTKAEAGKKLKEALN